MCEEIPNPGRNIPKVILVPLVIGFLTAFPFACSLMYAITDVKAVLNTAAGLPLIEIYRQGTGSQLAASILLAFFAFCFFGCLVANGKLHPTTKCSSIDVIKQPPHPVQSGQYLVIMRFRFPTYGCESIQFSRCQLTPCSYLEHALQYVSPARSHLQCLINFRLTAPSSSVQQQPSQLWFPLR